MLRARDEAMIAVTHLTDPGRRQPRPDARRRPPAQDPVEVLQAFPHPLASAEIAAVMTEHLGVPEMTATEAALIAAVGDGTAIRLPADGGSLWAPADRPAA